MGDTNTVLNHQRRESSTIDKDDAFCNLACEFSRLAGEAGGGDEDALPRTPPCKRPIERLHLWSTDRSLPAFRLNVNPLEPELVERNNPVDASITRMTHALKVLVARAVTQGVQQVEHQPFKERGWCLGDTTAHDVLPLTLITAFADNSPSGFLVEPIWIAGE